MEHTPLPAGTLLAARTLIDATSTFDPVATVAENQAALIRALLPLDAVSGGGASSREIASGAVICMQWLISRASEQSTAGGREEVLWSLREFVSAL